MSDLEIRGLLQWMRCNPSASFEECEAREEATFKKVGVRATAMTLLTILQAPPDRELWGHALNLLWSCALEFDLHDMSDEIVATTELLRERLERPASLADVEDCENLLWSIVCRVKHLSYLSDWEPLRDTEVTRLIGILRARHKP